MHAALRDALRSRIGGEADAMRILYGGSMNGANAASLLAVADVDGGLVGGASLPAGKFDPIIKAAAAACGRLERDGLLSRPNNQLTGFFFLFPQIGKAYFWDKLF